jgi:uncharacterized protein (TIGR03578 family)
MEKTVNQKVRVEGTGKSKEQAVNMALGKIQKKVMDEFKAMIIRIEPLGTEVIEATEQTYTERFLLFFFPRKRHIYKVVLDVNVNIILLKVDEIEFKKIDEQSGVMKSIYRNQQMADK